MKKILAGILVTILTVLSLSACGSSESETGSSSEDILSCVLDEGKLTACIELGNEPWAYTDTDSGDLTGFSVDLISGFAEAIGVEVELTPLEFSEMIPAVQEGKADIVASNISRTAARAATVLFTDAVGYSSCVAMVMEGSQLTSTTQLNDPSVTITAPAGNIYEDMAYEKFPDATINAVSSTSDAIAALKAGRADVYLTDTQQAQMLMESDSSVITLPEYLEPDTVAFALEMSPDAYTLRDAFNTYLKVIKINGEYNELYNKYFGTDWEPLMDEYGA